jgi:O-antigen/teichoic acid export membrane protein
MSTEPPISSDRPATPSLLQSGALSLFASVAPLVVALIALPVLTRQLGQERFGLLALAWAWLTYAGLLDFGLGRTLTRMVAAADAGEPLEAPITAFVSTSLVLLTVVGAVVGLGGAFIAPWYVTQVLHVSSPLRTDAIVSAVLFALTVPAITSASVPRAVLEARQQFRAVNMVRLPVSVATFAVPLLLLPVTASLTVIAVTLAVVRVWALWRYRVLARAIMAGEPQHPGTRAYVRPLLRAGAWMTVSNVLSPLLTVADRFVIGSLISVNAVALYAVPWEGVTRLFIIPGAVTMVLFPAITQAATTRDQTLIPLHSASVRLLMLIVVPICAIACLLAPWLLRLAGGPEYTGDSINVLRILAVGVTASCMAAVPLTLLQASGRARTTAILHLLEIVPFGVLLWYAITHWGILGAATAWTARAIIDAGLLAWCAQRVAPLSGGALLVNAGAVALVGLCAWLGATMPSSQPLPLLVAIVVACIVPALFWQRRTPTERLVLERAGSRR